MNAGIRRIIKASGGSWDEYRDNEWNGADTALQDGGILRLTCKGGEGEPVELFRFDRRMMLRWQGSFSVGAPVAVATAAVMAACGRDGEA